MFYFFLFNLNVNSQTNWNCVIFSFISTKSKANGKQEMKKSCAIASSELFLLNIVRDRARNGNVILCVYARRQEMLSQRGKTRAKNKTWKRQWVVLVSAWNAHCSRLPFHSLFLLFFCLSSSLWKIDKTQNSKRKRATESHMNTMSNELMT